MGKKIELKEQPQREQDAETAGKVASKSVLHAALDYASRGWHVFPVQIGTKRSHKSAARSNGRNWGASTDPDEIRNDWRQWPDANVGITTGEASGIFVIDLDTPEGHDGKDGIGTFSKWIEEYGELPQTTKARSPSGGSHIFFKWPKNLVVKTNSGKLAPGIDVRGQGGMVMGVPSVRKDGRYTWETTPDQCEPAECPQWLLDKIVKAQARWISSSVNTHGKFQPSDPVWDWFKASGFLGSAQSDGWWQIQCPWSNEHSDDDIRAYYLPRGGPNVRRGFNCFHSHPHTIDDLLQWVEERGGPVVDVEDRGTWQPRHRPVEADGLNEANQIELNQDALAKMMGERGWDQDARYVVAWKKWVFWDGTRWCVDENLQWMNRTREFLREIAAEMMMQAEAMGEGLSRSAANKLAKDTKRSGDKLLDKHMICAVETLARSNPASAAAPEVFDADLMLLGTPGGTVDLRSGVLRPAERSELITKMASVTPADEGSVPRLWLEFLNQIFEGDQEIIAFMQRFAGYALTGQTSEHKLIFLYGGGRNGKSVYLNTLHKIWGDYVRKAPSSTFLNSQQERHPTDVAGLQGARLVVGSELPVGKTWDESMIKDLTGGDVMTARYMRGDFFDFEPQLTLMIAGNNQPSFRGVDEAIRARVVLVPFNVTIPKARQDPDLPNKLMAEAPGILRWAITGAVQWQQQGLNVPPIISKASSEYFDDEDIVARFLEDKTENVPDNFVSSSTLYCCFKGWCAGEGLILFAQRTLIKDIRRRGYAASKSGNSRGLRGLALKPQSERDKIIAAVRQSTM
jgi:putative DNA primase/helicase